MRKFRYFLDCIDGQQKWLNKMAEKGYRLIGVDRLFYEFEKCDPSEYEYYVEFVGDKSYSEIKEYKNLIESLGLGAYTKNINLNFSIGKGKWRPWAKLSGQIATSPGGYNKELLILEKRRDGKKFEVHTDLKNLIEYYSPIRNMYLFTSLLLAMLLVLNQFTETLLSKIFIGAIAIITAYLISIEIRYSKIINNYKKRNKIYE